MRNSNTGAIVHADNRRADDAVYPQDVLEHLFTQMVEFVRCSSTDDISNPEEARVAMQCVVYLVIEEKVTSRPPVA